MRRTAITLKRAKVKDALLDLEASALRHDQRNVYALAKRLAPWRPRQRVAIRGPDGQILSPGEQVEVLRDHCLQKFSQDSPFSTDHVLDYQVNIGEEEVYAYLAHLPIRKATPPGVAPNAAWRACAKAVASTFTEAVNKEWCMGTSAEVPSDLKDAHMVWLPKPGKDASKPSGLRPIGLTHPLGKTVCAILRDRISPVLQNALSKRPQFAYTQGRSTLDALLRVHGHIRETGDLLRQGRKCELLKGCELYFPKRNTCEQTALRFEQVTFHQRIFPHKFSSLSFLRGFSCMNTCVSLKGGRREKP